MKTFAAALVIALLSAPAVFASGKCGTNVGRNSNTSGTRTTTPPASNEGVGVKH